MLVDRVVVAIAAEHEELMLEQDVESVLELHKMSMGQHLKVMVQFSKTEQSIHYIMHTMQNMCCYI